MYTGRNYVTDRVYNYLRRDRGARNGRPSAHREPIHLARKKEQRCWRNRSAGLGHDIEASVTERRDTRYRNRHGRQGPAHRPSHQAGNTGSPDPYGTASEARLQARAGVRGSTPGDARPERHQGRVAQLTHNAALASSDRRAPHSTRSTVHSSSRDEWVGARAISQRKARMTDDRALDLTHILVEYAQQCGAGSSFSDRVEAMKSARAAILELFAQKNAVSS